MHAKNINTRNDLICANLQADYIGSQPGFFPYFCSPCQSAAFSDEKQDSIIKREWATCFPFDSYSSSTGTKSSTYFSYLKTRGEHYHMYAQGTGSHCPDDILPIF